MTQEIQIASVAQASEIVGVLRDSIIELCTAEHQHDADTLETWLENKTIDNVACWLNDETQRMFVAIVDQQVAGVGLIHREGEIGLGGELLARMETQARQWGIKKLYLFSMKAARTFYEHHGFTSSDGIQSGFGVSVCYPYRKTFT